MTTPNTYNQSVVFETRNHKGYFVPETAYKLMGIDQSGWALICQDDTTCHYVDPDCLRAISEQEDNIQIVQVDE